MAKPAYVQGNLLNIFYNDGTNWKTFGYTQNNSLAVSNETTTISSKDHGLHPDTTVTGSSWTMSGESYFIAAEADIIMDMADSAKPYTFAFARVDQDDYAAGLKDVTNAPTGAEKWTLEKGTWIRYGNGIVTSSTITANNGEVATVQLEITGSGALSKTAPATINSYKAATAAEG